MTNLKNLKKADLISLMEEKGMMFSKDLTKAQLIKLYETQEIAENTNEEEMTMNNLELTNEVVILNTAVAIENPTIEENTQNEENEAVNEESIILEFANFLQFSCEADYVVDNNTFLITGSKKKICVRIDELTNFAHVFTVLNKKEFKKENARNILTLKSLKAAKSYTISNLK